MSLSLQIRSDAQAAQKEESQEGKRRLSVLRMIMAAMQNEEISLKVKDIGLTDEQSLAVVRREAKKRREAALLYRTHEEEERARAEEAELSIFEGYLPVSPSEVQIRGAVAEIMKALPEADRNMGRIMKEAIARFRGTADGIMVRTIVQDALQKIKI